MSKLTDDRKAWLLSYQSGQRFYEKKLKNSKYTEDLYTTALKKYCDAVGKNPDELIQLKIEGLQNPNTEIEFQAEELLENYLKSDALVPSAKLTTLTSLKSFYSSTRGRDLAKDTGENIEVPESKKRTPTLQDCIDLENAMTYQRDKFLLWFIESCPMRIGTIRKTIWRDLKPTGDKDVPYWVSIESTRLKGGGKGRYKGTKHIGFLHWYALQKLEAYKLELKQKGIEITPDSPLFVAYKGNSYGQVVGGKMAKMEKIFSTASLLAWKDLTKKRFSPHDLRDILSTVLEKPQVKANTNLGKPLISHKPQGIESTYANHKAEDDKPNEDYLTLFKMCLPYLVPETVPELKVELNQQKLESQKQVESINILNMELEDNKRTIKKNELEMRRNKDELMRQIVKLQIELGKLYHTSDVNPEKVNQHHAIEEAKREQAYVETAEENEREIPVSQLTPDERAVTFR